MKNKIEVNICDAPEITNEAKDYLKTWYKKDVKFSDLIFYTTYTECKNWIICKVKDQDMFFSLSLIDSCLSSIYGDTRHFEQRFKVIN